MIYKYVIETNMDDDYFGAFIPGQECRNVGIDEMKGYCYWPCDVFYMFMTICDHVLPSTLTYNKGEFGTICAMLYCDGGNHWLRFKRIYDSEAKASGLKEFNHSEWIDRLRKDKKNGKNYRSYNK